MARGRWHCRRGWGRRGIEEVEELKLKKEGKRRPLPFLCQGEQKAEGVTGRVFWIGGVGPFRPGSAANLRGGDGLGRGRRGACRRSGSEGNSWFRSRRNGCAGFLCRRRGKAGHSGRERTFLRGMRLPFQGISRRFLSAINQSNWTAWFARLDRGDRWLRRHALGELHRR